MDWCLDIFVFSSCCQSCGPQPIALEHWELRTCIWPQIVSIVASMDPSDRWWLTASWVGGFGRVKPKVEGPAASASRCVYALLKLRSITMFSPRIIWPLGEPSILPLLAPRLPSIPMTSNPRLLLVSSWSFPWHDHRQGRRAECLVPCTTDANRLCVCQTDTNCVFPLRMITISKDVPFISLHATNLEFLEKW